MLLVFETFGSETLENFELPSFIWSPSTVSLFTAASPIIRVPTSVLLYEGL